MAEVNSSPTRGLESAEAHSLPPALAATREDKAKYTIARYGAQNDHFVGIFKSWTKTLNFLIGEHWRTKWDGTSLSWNTERDIPEWRQQPVTNLVFAVYRAAMAKMTKQKPTLEVIPPTGNSEDREAAELAESVLQYLWRLLKKSQKVPDLVGWLLVTAEGYIRVGYDPGAGPLVPRTIPIMRPVAGAEPPPEGEEPEQEQVDVAADESGEPYNVEGTDQPDFNRKPDMERLGEVDWSIVSPLAVRFNPEATSVWDATEMYIATLWPKKKAAKHFGLKEEDIGGNDESGEQRALYEDLVSATAAGFPRSWADQRSNWGVSQQNAIGDRALVIEYYSKPDDDFTEGRHWITCGRTLAWPPENKAQQNAADKKVVTNEGEDVGQDSTPQPLFKDNEAPLPFGFWPPLVPVKDTPIPGQPKSVALLSQVVPLNEQLNVLDGKITEKHVMDSMGGAWFVSPEDKDIQVTSEPGQVIVSKAMGKRGAAFAPFQAQMKALPEAVYRERDVLYTKVQVVSGMSGPELSQKPEGVPSGRALLVSQETSDAQLMPLLFALESALEESGRRELEIVRAKYRSERAISIRKADGKYLYRAFKGSDLRDGHDVRVQVGSAFPWSKSAQWDARMAFLQAVPQLFTNPDGSVDEGKLAKYMDAGVPGLGPFQSDEDPDLLEINREHDQFEAYNPEMGEMQLPEIAYWQNSPKHLEWHYNFMKKDRARYERWHPAAQAAFQQHMMLTITAVEDAAERMMPNAGGGAAAPGGGAAAPVGPSGSGAPPPAGPPAGPPSGPPSGPPPAAPAPKRSMHLVRPGEGAPGTKLTPGDRRSAQMS